MLLECVTAAVVVELVDTLPWGGSAFGRGGSSPPFRTNLWIQKIKLVYAANSVDAGWSSLVARRAHNPKVVGSNPAPATNLILDAN